MIILSDHACWFMGVAKTKHAKAVPSAEGETALIVYQ